MSGHTRKKTILYFSPHQDDELLSMGIDICNSISEGHDVHVILCTDGSKCKIRNGLANGKECDKRPGFHTYLLTEEEFITARDKEFRESCRALGVEDGNVHILKNRVADGNLNICVSRKTILQFLNVTGPDSVVCTLDPNLENNRQHCDHKALGYAAVELFNEGFIRELRVFTEPYYSGLFHHKTNYIRGEVRTVIAAATLLVQGKLQKAVRAYSRWEPEAGRYAVGYSDIAKEFDALLKNGTSYCHICTRETAFPESGAGKNRKLIVSLTSHPDRLDSAIKTLATVYEQSLIPDMVILWLASSSFSGREKDLPEKLAKMTEENGLSIRWYGDDLKKQDRYLLAVNTDPDALVIAVDDDILCYDQFTENLYHSYLLYLQELPDVRVCFAPISIAGDSSLYEGDLCKIVTYCKEEVNCLKKLQDNCRELLDDIKTKHNIIVQMAKEIGRLKRN